MAETTTTYTFGQVKCDDCESTDIRPVGLSRALFHPSWCPQTPANKGKPVHPARRRALGQIEPCGGAISFRSKTKRYVCERCFDASQDLKRLTEGP